MSNQILTVVAKVEAKTNHLEALRKGLIGLIAPTLAENGCINYDLHQDHKNENTFLFYENWESRSHWEDHNVSVHIKAFQQATEGMIEKVEIFEMHKID
jgi:quinol monooxygenase YgiN